MEKEAVSTIMADVESMIREENMDNEKFLDLLMDAVVIRFLEIDRRVE